MITFHIIFYTTISHDGKSLVVRFQSKLVFIAFFISLFNGGFFNLNILHSKDNNVEEEPQRL